jgi:cation:H+ antiporter
MNGAWLSDLPLAAVGAGFLLAAAVIAIAGTRLTRVADTLADVTGLGEALFGAVLLGGSTSLSGIVTSVTAAWNGYPELAVSNAVGGIAAQTAFLAIADISYRRANLEHAAASVENLVQGALLVTLLAIPILAMAAPPLSLFGVNPLSPALILAYLAGTRLISQTRAQPLWRATHTRETREDEPHTAAGHPPLWRLWGEFVALGIVLGAAGWAVGHTGIALAERTPLGESVVGGLFTAVATSLPELVTALAAVRQGALTLAVGVIIGGNSFDVLFIALADVAYRDGSIYHAISDRQLFILALTLLLTGILLLGLLRREPRGIANIGFESFLVLLLYVAGFVVIGLTG